jgi:uncharacterized protein (TIGR02266 family)
MEGAVIVDDERRAMPRHEVTVDVTFESEHNFYRGLTQDLGAGGLFVATDALRPIGECIRVRFTLPGSPEVLDAITEVRWVRAKDTVEGDAGMGLQFLQMSAKTKQAVRAFAEKRGAMVHSNEPVR